MQNSPWGENIGWIHVKGTAADMTEYSVATSYYPTAVELVAFTAAPAEDGILLEWETASEVDNLGFHLYRSDAPDGLLAQLNAALIPSQNPGSPLGAVYAWLDETAAPSIAYYYWLEAVDVHGGTTRYGPVSAELNLLRRLLPVRPRLAPEPPGLRSR